jgi:hypothetical protein
VLWPVADRSVRVVKTVRTLHKNRVPLRPASASKKPNAKEAFDQQGLNFYATNVELGLVPPSGPAYRATTTARTCFKSAFRDPQSAMPFGVRIAAVYIPQPDGLWW